MNILSNELNKEPNEINSLNCEVTSFQDQIRGNFNAQYLDAFKMLAGQYFEYEFRNYERVDLTTLRDILFLRESQIRTSTNQEGEKLYSALNNIVSESSFSLRHQSDLASIHKFKTKVYHLALDGEYGDELKHEALEIQKAICEAQVLESQNTLQAKFNRLQLEFSSLKTELQKEYHNMRDFGDKLSLSFIFKLDHGHFNYLRYFSEIQSGGIVTLKDFLKPLVYNEFQNRSKDTMTYNDISGFKNEVLREALKGSYGEDVKHEALEIQKAIYEAQVLESQNTLQAKFKRLQVEFNLTLQDILNLTKDDIRYKEIYSPGMLFEKLKLHSVLKTIDSHDNIPYSNVKADKLINFKISVLDEAVKGTYGEEVQQEALDIQRENKRKAKLLSPEAQSDTNRPVLVGNFACDSMDEWIIGKFLLDYLTDNQGNSFQITNKTFQCKVQSPNDTTCRLDYVIPASFTTQKRPCVLEWHPFREDLERKKIKQQLKNTHTTAEVKTELEILLNLANESKPRFKHEIQTNYTNYRSILATQNLGDNVQVVCFQEGIEEDRKSLYDFLIINTNFQQNGSIKTFKQFKSQWLVYSEEIKKIQNDKKIKRAAEKLHRVVASQGIQLDNLTLDNIKHLLDQRFKFNAQKVSIKGIKKVLKTRLIEFENDQKFLVYLQDFAKNRSTKILL